MFHPAIADRSCDDCRQWQYNDGENGDKRRVEFHGRPLPRQPGTLPCELKARNDKCQGCPKGHWSDPAELSEKNTRAWQHYKECRATGKFPNDAIVARNASIIAEIEHQAEREHDLEILSLRMRLDGLARH